MKERITGVTVAQNGQISYEGTSALGHKFTHTTYLNRDRFDWRSIPGTTPVLDLEGESISKIWPVCLSRDHASFGAKAFACRNAGLRVTTVRAMRERVVRAGADGRSTPNRV